MKSKKECAVAAASPRGAGSNIGRKDKRASHCTMNFTGHKVCCIFIYLFSGFPLFLVSKANPSSLPRTRSFPSPSPTNLGRLGHKNSVISIDLRCW